MTLIMTKIYQKDGNTNKRNKYYCKKCFIEKYKREPNILDVVSLGRCHHCGEKLNAENE